MTHEAGIEAATHALKKHYYMRGDNQAKEVIQAYLSASGMVLVSETPTQGQLDVAHSSGALKAGSSAFDCWTAMVSAAPDPFKSKP